MTPSQPSQAKYLREDDISQKCRDLLPSLPHEKGWITPSLYQYQDFWVAPKLLNSVLACQDNFRAQETDIFLITAPKSGTTWLKAILFCLLNRAKYSGSMQQHPLLTQSPHDLVPFLELKLYFGQEIPNLTSLPPPRLFATHLPYQSLPQSVKDSGCKLVYLCRNPKDTFVSLWHFANKLRSKETGGMPLGECLDAFCQGVSPFGPYWDHVQGYYKVSLEMPDRVLFLRYEDMKEDPHVHVKRLADFLGCPFSEQELRDGTVDGIVRMCSFDSLSMLEVNKSGQLSTGQETKSFFRKGDVGDWVNYMSVEMGGKIDRVMQEKMHGSGLKL
ncbi:cytosolic sulfotransferase 12-like [Syzygium oleosum]|uniref:cytosolic sulfotransferase 12-like n=1 Tax=Syzygium oleosum TaxID=219896 RepID=UPI0011D1946C|nr:cytosolic sulfotransferase 12-like [Syzygium oleosum]